MNKHYCRVVIMLVGLVLITGCRPKLDDPERLPASVETARPESGSDLTTQTQKVTPPTTTNPVEFISSEPSEGMQPSATAEPPQAAPDQEVSTESSKNLALEQRLQALGFVETGMSMACWTNKPHWRPK